jgi:hypothetical protein
MRASPPHDGGNSLAVLPLPFLGLVPAAFVPAASVPAASLVVAPATGYERSEWGHWGTRCRLDEHNPCRPPYLLMSFRTHTHPRTINAPNPDRVRMSVGRWVGWGGLGWAGWLGGWQKRNTHAAANPTQHSPCDTPTSREHHCWELPSTHTRTLSRRRCCWSLTRRTMSQRRRRRSSTGTQWRGGGGGRGRGRGQESQPSCENTTSAQTEEQHAQAAQMAGQGLRRSCSSCSW